MLLWLRPRLEWHPERPCHVSQGIGIQPPKGALLYSRQGFGDMHTHLVVSKRRMIERVNQVVYKPTMELHSSLGDLP